MSILVGKKAPTFVTQAVHSDGEVVGDYNFADAIDGKYGVVFFYPLDFTFVCPSEILAMAARTEKLKSLGCEVVGISVDSHWTHNAWRNTAVDDGGIGAVPFTLAADMSRKISKKYGILAKSGKSYYPAGVSMRATFVIDQKGIVRHQVVNDEPLGRNMDEVVRRERSGLPCRLEQGRCRHDQHPRRCGQLPRRERRKPVGLLRLKRPGALALGVSVFRFRRGGRDGGFSLQSRTPMAGRDFLVCSSYIHVRSRSTQYGSWSDLRAMFRRRHLLGW